MSKSHGKVAKKYAKALLEAYDIKDLDAVRDALNIIANAWRENIELRQVLLNPGLKQEGRAAVLVDVAKSVRAGDQQLSNFLALLLESNRLPALPEISQTFSTLVDELKKAMALEITSAFALPDGERQQLEGKLRADFGQMASINWGVDQSLIGGLVVRCGDKLLDGSVSGTLQRFRSELLG